jgi:hypothetical protein
MKDDRMLDEIEVGARSLRAAFLRSAEGAREMRKWEALPPLVRDRYRSEAAAVLKAVWAWRQTSERGSPQNCKWRKTK